MGLASLKYGIMPAFRLVVEEFRAYACTGDSNTARSKRASLNHFEAFILNEKGSCDINEITPEDIRNFLKDRERRGEAPATIAARHSIASHFFKYAEARHPGTFSPVRGVRAPRVIHGLPKRAPKEQVSAIREHLQGDDYEVLKVAIAFQLLEGCGLRLDELRRLAICNLDLERGLIVDLIRKANVSGPIPIPQRTIEALRVFLPIRNEHLHRHGFRYGNLNDRVRSRYPLLASTYNASSKSPFDPAQWRYSPKAIYSWIVELGRKTGQHIHPHQLRHTFGDRVMKATHDPRLTAAALGHATLNQVIRYTSCTEEDVRNVINKEGFDEA